METREKIADDLILTAAGIADELGVSEAQVHNWIKQKLIPVGHIGRTIVARRSALKRWMQTATGT